MFGQRYAIVGKTADDKVFAPATAAQELLFVSVTLVIVTPLLVLQLAL